MAMDASKYIVKSRESLQVGVREAVDNLKEVNSSQVTLNRLEC